MSRRSPCQIAHIGGRELLALAETAARVRQKQRVATLEQRPLQAGSRNEGMVADAGPPWTEVSIGTLPLACSAATTNPAR